MCTRLKSTKPEMIWNAVAVAAVDLALLQQCLDGATTEDLEFEKMDDGVRHAACTRNALHLSNFVLT
jgi:hypothetical protein